MATFRFNINPNHPWYNNAIHLMIDIETLDTSVNAVITEIGICGFDMDGGQTNMHVPIQIDLDWVSQTETREISLHTVDWHMRQGTADRLTNPDVYRIPLAKALESLSSYINDCNVESSNVFLWNRGVSFDTAILRHALDEYNLREPYGFKYVEEMRTLCQLGDLAGLEHFWNSNNNTHVASQDAEHQARHVQYILSSLYGDDYE